jgi:hypothetical protein
MRILRVLGLGMASTLVIVWTAGCTGGGKTGESGSAVAPSSAKQIAFGPGEAAAAPAADGSSDLSGAVPALDVAGVRLGMTPEQAAAALKAFDSSLLFSKRYLTDRDVLQIAEQPDESPVILGKTGEPEECAKISEVRLFTGILAAKSTAFLWGKTGGRGYVGCWIDATTQPVDEQESVYVCFSPEPGGHRVIGVALRTRFKTATKVDAALAGVLKSYPRDFTGTYTHDASNGNSVSYQSRFWRFDASGKTLSETAARAEGTLGIDRNSGELPSHVIEGAGVGLDLQLLDSANHEVAQELGVALYDENALYQFNGRAKAVYDDLRQKGK